METYFIPPYVFTAWYLIKRRDIFALHLTYTSLVARQNLLSSIFSGMSYFWVRMYLDISVTLKSMIVRAV